MKRSLFMVVGVCLLLMQTKSASAVLAVGSYGETGWQKYSFTAQSGFSGYMGFLVSDTGDDLVASQFLIDNVTINGALYQSFESGFTPAESHGDFSTASSYSHQMVNPPTGYNPTNGSQMLFIDSNGFDPNTMTFGQTADTSAFGFNSVDGVYVYIPLTLSAQDVLAFDWAFMTKDYDPFNDYAMFMLKDDSGETRVMLANILGGSQEDPLNPSVPEPATVSLLGIGLAGALLRKKLV